MFNSVVLDVVIGLVFIYLLYSLLASVLQEIIATNIRLRAYMLRRAIVKMLDDTNCNKCSSEKFSNIFYDHPLIKYLGTKSWFEKIFRAKEKTKPSYITPENFSKVIIDLLRGEKYRLGGSQSERIGVAISEGKLSATKGNQPEIIIETETIRYLKSIWADSQGDVEKFKVLLEQWFNDTMERARGWYKQQVQVILFVLGFFIAAFFNVDTIVIAKKLSNDKEARAQMVNMANSYIESSSSIKIRSGEDKLTLDSEAIKRVDSLYQELDKQLNGDIAKANSILGLGAWLPDSIEVSWQKVANDAINKIAVFPIFIDKKALPKKDLTAMPKYVGFGFWDKFSYLFCLMWYHKIGFLLTAIAISFGAPFWFDLLNKLMKLRGSTQQQNTVDKPNSGENTIPTIKRHG